MKRFRYYTILILALCLGFPFFGYAKSKPPKKAKKQSEKQVSVNILKNNTLIYSAVAQGDWLTASKRMVENVGQDWNSDIAYYKVQSVSKKASKTPMPVIDNTNAVSTIFSLIAAPFQALASVASSLGPDYVTVNATVKDTFNLSYQFFYRLHLTENAAEAFDFYYFLQKNGWDPMTFMHGLSENKVSRKVLDIPRINADSLQKLSTKQYQKTTFADEQVIQNIFLLAVISGDTCTIERMFYGKWVSVNQVISPVCIDYAFLSKKVKATYPEYILAHAIQIAVYKNDVSTARLLLKKGANPNEITNTDGKILFLGITPDRKIENFRKAKTCIELTQNEEMQKLLKNYGGKTLFKLRLQRFWRNLKKTIGF